MDEPRSLVEDSKESKLGESPPIFKRRNSTRRSREARRVWRLGAVIAICLFAYTFIKHLNRNVLPFHEAFSTYFGHYPRTAHAREKLFLSVPSAESALEAARAYATHPHIAGSTEDLLDAKTLLHLFQDELHIPKSEHLPIYNAGSEESRNATLSLTSPHASHRPSAWIDTYYPLMDRGLSQSLEILGETGKVEWIADLLEDGDPGDPDAHKYRLAVPPYHGYSADGDATGQLIYANYGMKEDYDELVAQGANLTGKIVIARYGGPLRGLKIKGAEDLGAIGVLLYSDTRDDGFVTTENGYLPYPAGPARNPTSVERGSVGYLNYPGDPTTPGYPSYENAKRVEREGRPKIPSLPISWANAQKLLREIGDIYSIDSNGKEVLSGTASSKNVRLVNRVDKKIIPIWNTMAAIPGHIRNEVVIVGCHRDAWVIGAADPTSGTVSLHEVVRGFGALLRHGWRPLRTVVIASWDAEEPALIGSTEWAEDFSSWISENVVSYLNLDTAAAGSALFSGGSPSLAHLIRGVAQDIPHPTVPGKTMWDARNDEGTLKGALSPRPEPNATNTDGETISPVRQGLEADDTGVIALGSGSDFTVFLQRLGVASSHIEFARTPSDPVYHMHSIYDTQVWQERYGDVGFHKQVAVAKHLGLMTMRLADSIVLPLNTTQYALELHDYLTRIEGLLPSPQDNSKVQFSALKRAIRRVHQASIALDKEKTDAEEDFNKLRRHIPWRRRYNSSCSGYNQLLRFVKRIAQTSAPSRSPERPWLQYLDESVDMDEAEEQQIDQSKALPFPIRRFIEAARRVGRVNKKLMKFERGFLSEDGLKGREWFKHLGVAPGKWLGYGATTFPALTEAVELEKDGSLIEYEAGRLEDLLNKLADNIEP